jgi:hypothetical protein
MKLLDLAFILNIFSGGFNNTRRTFAMSLEMLAVMILAFVFLDRLKTFQGLLKGHAKAQEGNIPTLVYSS